MSPEVTSVTDPANAAFNTAAVPLKATALLGTIIEAFVASLIAFNCVAFGLAPVIVTFPSILLPVVTSVTDPANASTKTAAVPLKATALLGIITLPVVPLLIVCN